MSKTNRVTTSVLAITFALSPFMSAAAMSTQTSTAFKLKTSVQEVNGVREIEAKDYLKGIRKAQAALDKTTVKSQQAPLLTNLCVAHIATQQFSAAQQYCDAAVQAKENAISLNNRAVLKCLTGNTLACTEDFEKANLMNNQSRIIAKNLSILQQHYALEK